MLPGLVTPQKFYPLCNGCNPHPLFGFIYQFVLNDVKIGGCKDKSADNSRCRITVVLAELSGRQPLRLAIELMDLAIQLMTCEFFIPGLVESNPVRWWLEQAVPGAATKHQQGGKAE